MNEAFALKDTLLGIFQNLGQFVIDLVPRLISGVVVLIVGIIVAKIVEKVLKTTFFKLQADKMLEKIGITATMRGFGVTGSLSEGSARLLYWLLVILFLQSAATTIGFTIVADAIDSFFGFVPNMVAAFLVLMLGNVVAQFAGKAVEQAGTDAGVTYARSLSRAVSAGILFIVAIMAITQLGIDTEMIRTVAVIGMAGGALALALSFGIGGRDITRNLLAGFYARKLFRIGDPLEIRGVRGTLTAITPTQTLIDQDGQRVAIANSSFLDEVARQ
ncbi:MAG: mechanosensitive ion channel [Gemmatimonadetes bacterium]|nr:mechanosensitive ion channel [Gemmatimonadota bacterium]